MTNFIRTDQEHKKCAGMFKNQIFDLYNSVIFIGILESPIEKESACSNDDQCRKNKDFQKVGILYNEETS